jgi:hypothetical protein
MSARSAHSGMNGNKAFRIRDSGFGKLSRRRHLVPESRVLNPESFFIFLCFMLMPALAQAQGSSAPAMFAVKEVVVQFAHFGNAKTADDCGLSQEELAFILNKTLKENGVPAISVAEAKPPMIGAARIELAPDIFSFNSQGLDCTSWVSLSAESRNSVHIPPVDISRNVTITYWHEGTLLSSSQTTHERTVADALQKLVRHFAQQYKLDQPPPLPEQ